MLMKHFFLLSTFFVCLTMIFNSCSSDKDKESQETYIIRLETKQTQLEGIRDIAIYGDKIGQYPESSKQILDNVLGELVIVLNEFKAGQYSQLKFDTIMETADKAIKEFRASVRTEDAPFNPKPAYLKVYGEQGGYIDFGNHIEYTKFGESGKQKFTVEMWCKFENWVDFGYILSTISDVAEDNIRCGWFVNIHHGNFRQSLGLENYQLREPAFNFTYSDVWMHFAAVVDEEGVDGSFNNENPNIIKLYKDGVFQSEMDADIKYASSEYPVHMIAFAKNDPKGAGNGVTGDCLITGSIKKLRIWKSAKTANEIQNLMNGTTVVTGQEADLVCGWDFTQTVEDENKIPDLTGKFSAKLCGTYEWITE